MPSSGSRGQQGACLPAWKAAFKNVVVVLGEALGGQGRKEDRNIAELWGTWDPRSAFSWGYIQVAPPT